MAMRPFLAMTAGEIRKNSVFPEKIAWMACHFSPYGLGLSNLPRTLPEGTLLILDDVTPPNGHDPQLIADQLAEYLEAFRCSGVLLDFQRSGCEETAALAAFLSQVLPCPVAVSDVYAKELTCAVFLSPVPPSRPLQEHIAPWLGRDIWLEICLEGESITLTERGAAISPLSYFVPPDTGLSDQKLHCHYKTELRSDAAHFTLWRTADDLGNLLTEAEALGIQTTVGLYQELCTVIS